MTLSQRSINNVESIKGGLAVVLIESSEILSALNILQKFSDEFRFHEASKAYLGMIKFIQSMEKETDDYSSYTKENYAEFFLKVDS